MLAVSGCSLISDKRYATACDAELQRSIGKTVTLQGKFEIGGLHGPYIHRPGAQVYLIPTKPNNPLGFSWGAEYGLMQGKVVSVTGILRFQHWKRVKPEGVFFNQPYDYFYFDAGTVKINDRVKPLNF